MKKTAFYIRVSTHDQSLASQREEMERWAKAFNVEGEWYEDKFTGATMNRPGMDRLMRDLTHGKLEKIVVWRIDRLGRTVLGLVQLFDLLQALDVTLVSIRDNVDLSTATGRLMANVLASVAMYETETRKDRQAAGIAVAKAAGKYKGGAKYTFKKNPAQIAKFHEDYPDIPLEDIARMFGVCRDTVKNYIKFYRTLHKEGRVKAAERINYSVAKIQWEKLRTTGEVVEA